MHKWLTPDNVINDAQIDRCLVIPERFLPFVGGALLMLAESQNWEQFGDMTPDECANECLTILETYYAGCP